MKNGSLLLSTLTVMLGCSATYATDAANIIPTPKPGYTLNITGLLLEPSASNLVYAIHTNPLPLPAPNWSQEVVNPAYSGALNLALQYNFNDSSNNVKFNWMYLGSNDGDSAGSTPLTSIGPDYYYGPANQFLLNTAANSSVRFDISNGNLVFGHLINLNDHIVTEPFVGLSAAYLSQKITDNYWGTDPVYGNFTHGVYTKSNFIGIGPRLGIDSTYYFSNRFALNAGIGADLLAGFINYSTNFLSWTAYTGGGAGTHNTTPTKTSMANQNINRIVPELDAKLAMLYTIPLDQSGSALTLEAGFMYAVYFNAINEVLPNTLVPTSWEAGSVAIVNQSQSQSNIDLRGPYISVAWKI